MNTRGFTLVEMLIALAIFGMLTAAGVTLLTLTARTQQSSDRSLGELGELRRLAALLRADLAQAAPRIHRDSDGRPQRAFAGDSGEAEALLLFVRRGWDDGASGGGVQRVGYRLRAGQIERLAYRRVDGSRSAAAVRLVGEVSMVRLRYRDRDGAWLARWQPADPTRLPAAVELVSNSAAHGLVRQVFVVGIGR